MNEPRTEPVDRYLEAVRGLSPGRTASFADIARLAGRATAARAAGRAVASCALDTDVPWHRVVSSTGALAADPERAAVQLARLRAEGARPAAGESIAAWARRVGASWVGRWRGRTCARADDHRVATWPAEAVEPFVSEASACERGFVDLDRAAALPPTGETAESAS